MSSARTVLASIEFNADNHLDLPPDSVVYTCLVSAAHYAAPNATKVINILTTPRRRTRSWAWLVLGLATGVAIARFL